jgi:branched-chain amino acid transport system ATP-binding protein
MTTPPPPAPPGPGTAAAPPLLQLERVSKRYGALQVIDDLSLQLAPGEALGVLGPNGAGKSTMFNLITGDVRPDAGRVRFDGRDITRLPASARCHLGIGRSYQVPHPFAGMTVFENLLVGAMFGARLAHEDANAHCVAVLEQTGLLPKANQLAGGLPLLDRKRLELARALATRPRLLLLDEIAGGLTDQEAKALVATIADIRSAGVSIVWIEHVVHALLAVVDRLVVINFGTLLTEGKPDVVMASREVREVYMGIEA